jgi:hypothetical protein
MTQREKLIDRMRNNPKGVRFEDVDALLAYYGFERRQPGSGSSHYVYRRGAHVITIARHKPFVHSQAVREILRILDDIVEEE